MLSDFPDEGTKCRGKRSTRATLEIISVFYYLCVIDDNTLPSIVLKMGCKTYLKLLFKNLNQSQKIWKKPYQINPYLGLIYNRISLKETKQTETKLYSFELPRSEIYNCVRYKLYLYAGTKSLSCFKKYDSISRKYFCIKVDK